ALEDFPGLHCVPDHADPGVLRRVVRLRVPRYERLIGLYFVAHVVDLEGFQPVGGVLEAGEQRVELAAGHALDAPAHNYPSPRFRRSSAARGMTSGLR